MSILPSAPAPQFLLRLVCSVAMVGLFLALAAQAQEADTEKSVPRFGTDQEPAVADPVQEPTAEKPIRKTGNDKIRFSFNQQQWKPIIEFFAEEAGFSLQPIDEPPPGTFNYQDDREYTIMEGLDLINGALRLRGYTLIRNQKMLLLRKDTDLPESLIETVEPEDLDQRGKYEVLRCVYNLDNLEGLELEEQVSNLVADSYRNYFRVFPAASKMIVVETGGNLRTIRGLISEARRKVQGDVFQQYRLQYVDAESLLAVVRPLMKIPNQGAETPDGTFSFAVEPLGDKIFLKGLQEKVDEFLSIAKMVDKEEDVDDGPEIEKPFLRQYATVGDAELAFQVLQTMLEGREGVQMDQDESSGAIILRARKDEHDIAVQTLAELSRNPNSWAQLPVNSDPLEILAKLQAMFRVDELETDNEGPIMVADTENDLIIVRGKPQEVALIKEMVLEFDKASAQLSGPRSSTRVIEIGDAQQADELMNLLPDLFGQTSRRNRLKFVMPEERMLDQPKNRGLPSRGLPPPDKTDEDSNRDGPSKGASGQKKTNRVIGASSGLEQLRDNASLVMGVYAGVSPLLATLLQDEQDPQGETSDETLQRQQRDGYKPPVQIPSIPNAPIEIKRTQFGLVLTSDDLDALDDLEYLIRERLEMSSEVQLPTVFYLKHRKCDLAIVVLENILGISDSGGAGAGGGGGGLGGMMAGMVGNALGGPASDILGGLLGGDGGLAGTTGIELEGDVRISTDIALNTLIISGATENDLDLINELIDYIDQPEAPHDPDLIGRTYVIPVSYYDPAELKTIIENQLPDLIKKEAAAGGGQQQQQMQQMQQMAQMMQRLTGGGRGGGNGSSNPDAERPKAVLGVDAVNRLLLVTGPEFIYRRVLEVVEELDKKELNVERRVESVQIGGKLNAQMLQGILSGIYGDKIEVYDGTGSAVSGQPGASGNPATPGSRPSPNEALEQANNAMRSQIMQAMQRAQQARQQGGGRGGSSRGGGSRGGGGRGGR